MNTTHLTFEDIKHMEWLYTNGLGGYASSTICGMNSRRYHGLLVASNNPPTQRQVLVSGVEDSIWDEDQLINLSTNQYPGKIHPDGYTRLVAFNRQPLPEMVFEANGYTISKNIFMVYGSNTTVLTYRNNSEKEVRVKARPLFVYRDFHSLFYQNGQFDFYLDSEKGTYKTFPYKDAHPIYFKGSDNGAFFEGREWLKHTEYFKELLRGQDFAEDRYALGYYYFDLEPEEEGFLMFSADPGIFEEDPAELREKEKKRIAKLEPKTEDPFYNDLVINSEQFLVHRQSTNSYSILAGYHWFADWGRDTMISLLGLMDSGKKKEAKSILSTFLKYLDEGMLPNRFPDYEGEPPEYNTVDATLWLFVALYYYDEHFGDDKFITGVLKKLQGVVDFHIKGTRYGIKVEEDTGLLRSTDSSVQLTWMDAKVGDYVVTPRTGFAVEINALWYNALKVYAHFLQKNDKTIPGTVSRMTKLVEKNFKNFFWNEQGYLNDYVDMNGEVDTSIRPNQIYTVSLPFNLLEKNKEKQVIQVVKDHLVTGFGLRSLSMDHSDFRPIYTGDQWMRDTAYHQGTVWVFILGDYLLAYLRVNNYSKKVKKEVKAFLKPLENHFYTQNCIYGISEIFDGQTPDCRRGKGCINQAWSIFNLVRVLKVCNQ